MQNKYLDSLAKQRGIMPKYYDPTGAKYGRPTFPFHYAPKGLMTRRQLRAANLSPGGKDPVAQVLWRHQKQTRKAYLYDAATARPKRVPTPAQLAAIQKATDARKMCPSCDTQQTYCIPKSLGECWRCSEQARQPSAGFEAA